MVQFYDDPEPLFEAVTRFLMCGFADSEPAVVIATEDHRNAFAGRLAANRILAPSMADERIWMLDAATTLASFMIDGMPDPTLFEAAIGGVMTRIADRHPGRPIRAYGEMVDLLWRDGNSRAALALEEMWNDLGKRYVFSLFCAYAVGNFYTHTGDDDMHAVCAAHSHVIPSSGEMAMDVVLLQLRARALEHEIEQRKQLEAALRRALDDKTAAQTRLEGARREAERANHVKDEFLAMLGHELRNPLSPILSAVQLMKLRGDESEREQEIIERQVKHLIHLVDDLLDVSRISKGKVELDMKPMSLATLLAAAIEITAPQFEDHHHRVTVSAPDDDVWVNADEVRLCQVFTNVLANAAKYTDPGGAIDVRVDVAAHEVTVRIKDTGIGVAPDLLPHMFDLFVQGVRGSDRRQGGLGIGLALVRRLVELHGGQVSANSDGPNRGTEISVRLPRIDARRAPQVSDKPLGTGTTARRVLVVDDNDDAAGLLGDLLRSLGHEVAVANTSAAAIEIANRFAPQVAILDIGMPEMDGYEL
ncbi:MAG TPA: ATP-binding protein, partial [Kofleriaceae bacterium]|nr:ATP-binding protein [Kofleriaceae bacterium]